MPAKRNRFTTFSHTDREQIEALLKTPRPSCRKKCAPPELGVIGQKVCLGLIDLVAS